MSYLIAFKASASCFFIGLMFPFLIFLRTLFLLVFFIATKVTAQSFKLNIWTVALVVSWFTTFETGYSFRGLTIFGSVSFQTTVKTIYTFRIRTFSCKMSFLFTVETRTFLALLNFRTIFFLMSFFTAQVTSYLITIHEMMPKLVTQLTRLLRTFTCLMTRSVARETN